MNDGPGRLVLVVPEPHLMTQLSTSGYSISKEAGECCLTPSVHSSVYRRRLARSSALTSARVGRGRHWPLFAYNAGNGLWHGLELSALALRLIQEASSSGLGKGERSVGLDLGQASRMKWTAA
jgi:hypothetical protein